MKYFTHYIYCVSPKVVTRKTENCSQVYPENCSHCSHYIRLFKSRVSAELGWLSFLKHAPSFLI